MKPLQHARITGRHYGGEWQDWIAIHDWIDRSKAIFPSMQHRMFLHFKLSVMLWGSPGVGKSGLVTELARRREAKLRDVRLSQKTASDIGGLPALDHQNKQTTFYLPDFLPREDETGILF